MSSAKQTSSQDKRHFLAVFKEKDEKETSKVKNIIYEHVIISFFQTSENIPGSVESVMGY